MIKNYLIAFFLLLTFGTRVFADDMINIYIISDKNFVGDRSNLLGVANSTESYFKKHNQKVGVYEHEIEDLELVKNNIIRSKNKSIILSCGPYGITAISYLKADPKVASNSIAIHLSHQIFDSNHSKHTSLVQKQDYSGADLIILPSHVLDDLSIKLMTSDKTQLLQTIGVAHNTYSSDIEKAYERDKNLLPKSHKFLGIILGGDAPDSNGKIYYYTPLESAKLAMLVSKLAKSENYTVLVTNGPRTGKHDVNTGKVMDFHKDGKIDPVTQKFIEVLDVGNVNYKLFDFQKGQPSYKELIFGALMKHNGSKILVPGESTSMISESIDLLPKGSIIIYKNEAMNIVHEKYVESEFENGRASIMGLDMKIKTPAEVSNFTHSARDLAAEKIYSLMQERFGNNL
jgi:hypothetical protein